MDILLVGLGGGLGAICRYAISSLPSRTVFPLLTLLVNFLGAVIIGVLAGLLSARENAPAWISPLLKTGFCGGFTTFSTFSLEAVTLWKGGHTAQAVLYAGASVTLCCCGVVLGQALARRVFG